MDARAIVAGAAAVTVLAASAALTTAEAMAASAPAASPARPSSSGASSPLLLVDGTRLLARPAPGGGSAVTVLPGAAPGGLISLRLPTAHVAATAATSEVTMTTPRAAAPAAVTFTAAFRDQHGNSAGVDWFDAPGAIWVSPMSRKPAGGALQAYASEVAASSLRPGVNPYVYNLDYADTPDVIPAQHYQVRPSSLATVTERYYRDSSSSGAWDNFGAFPEQGFVSWILRPLALPGTQVQYFSTGPQLIWNTTIYARASASGFPSGGQQDDAWHVLSPGPQAMDWNDYPLHPQPEVSAGGPGGSLFPLIPSAIRAGNTLTLTMRPFGDNQPGHLGSPVATQTSSYQIDQNGTPIAHGSAGNGIPPVTLSPKPSLISFTLNGCQDRPGLPAVRQLSDDLDLAVRA